MGSPPERSPSGPPVVETAIDDGESTGSVVVGAVAAVVNAEATDLPALYEAVDPDALDALFRDRTSKGRVTFEYCGLVVAVTADGLVRVYEHAERGGTRVEPAATDDGDGRP